MNNENHNPPTESQPQDDRDNTTSSADEKNVIPTSLDSKSAEVEINQKETKEDGSNSSIDNLPNNKDKEKNPASPEARNVEPKSTTKEEESESNQNSTSIISSEKAPNEQTNEKIEENKDSYDITSDETTEPNQENEIVPKETATIETKSVNTDETSEIIECLRKEKKELQTKIGALEKEKKELQTKIGTLEKEKKELQTKKLPSNQKTVSKNEVEFDDLPEEKLSLQKQEVEKDKEKLEQYIRQINYWKKQEQNLKEIIESILTDFKKKLDESLEIKQKLNPEVQKKLEGRQKALQLTFKMLERLQQELLSWPQRNLELRDLPEVKEQDIRQLLKEKDNDKQSIQKAIGKKIQDKANERWQIITNFRNNEEQFQKQIFQTIEKKLLPIIDGINDGYKNSLDLLKTLTQTITQEEKEQLTQWIDIHQKLDKIFSEYLEKLKVSRMEVEVGTSVDYSRCEPIETELDDNLPHESIKEVTRYGYEYELENAEKIVLRPAQVIVVKNN